MRVDSVNSGVRMKFPKGPFIFYEVGGAGGIWVGGPGKKRPWRGGHLKKSKGKGGSRKILRLLEWGRGKKISYWGGGSCNFLMTLQKIPPAPPPTSWKMNGP